MRKTSVVQENQSENEGRHREGVRTSLKGKDSLGQKSLRQIQNEVGLES